MTTSIRSETSRSVISVNGVDKLSLPTSGTPIPTGLFKKLTASATGLSAIATITADYLMVDDGQGCANLRNVSVTPSLSSSGANGLDTGTSVASTWYSMWVIWNPASDTVAGLFSLSETSPTMPIGYTHKARVGWVRTDGTANKYPFSFYQIGKTVRYRVSTGSNLTSLPTMAVGVFGNPTTPTYASISVDGFIPPTANAVDISYYTATSAAVLLSDTTSYGALSSTTNPPQIVVNMSTSASSNDLFRNIARMTVSPEGRNLYGASNVSSTDIRCVGWEDNL